MHQPDASAQPPAGAFPRLEREGVDERTIAVSQYSSGPIGRLVWQDVLGLVQFYKKQAK